MATVTTPSSPLKMEYFTLQTDFPSYPRYLYINPFIVTENRSSSSPDFLPSQVSPPPPPSPPLSSPTEPPSPTFLPHTTPPTAVENPSLLSETPTDTQTFAFDDGSNEEESAYSPAPRSPAPVHPREFLISRTWVEEPPGFELFSRAIENIHFWGNSSEKVSSHLSEARVFISVSSYTFNIKNLGTHLVRLQFSSFTSWNHDFRTGNFGVSANWISLLLNYCSNVTTIKEFFYMVVKDELEIMFMASSDSDFGFVNAIEVFSTPKNFFIDAGGITLISSEGMTEFKQNVPSQLFETIHRINVGGSLVTLFNDTLWRSWIPDEDFLVLKSATKVARSSDPPNYEPGGSTRKIAPDTVYMTAQQMNIVNGSLANHSKINWNFPVRFESSAMHLVRFHFGDNVTISLNTLYFNKYINEVAAYKEVDWSVLAVRRLASPFYIDFVVENMNGTSVFQVSVSPSDLSSIMRKNVILNGVDVMRMVNYVPLPISTKKKNRWIIFAAVVGGVFLLSVGAVLILAIRICRKRNRNPKARRSESGGWTSLHAFGGSSQTTIYEGTNLAFPEPYGYYTLKIPFADHQLATNNFDNNLMTGSGVFGMVYKSVLKDNMKVVVERGMPGSKQGVPEFQTVITVQSNIRHRHLFSLIGYCKEQFEMILVYEYMEKGPLRNHLYGIGLPPLSWKQWLEICIGAARGLHYLHTGLAQGIIHRDIKSTNILLDQNNRLVARLEFKGIDKLRVSIRNYKYRDKYREAAIHYWTGAATLLGFFSEENDKVGDQVVKKNEFIETTRKHSVTILVAKFDGILGLGFIKASVGNANPVWCFLDNWKNSFLDQIDQDQRETMAYLDAFANSSLPILIVKGIRNEHGYELSAKEPTGTSPRACLRTTIKSLNSCQIHSMFPTSVSIPYRGNATWGDHAFTSRDYLSFHLEDKVIFEDGGNDTPIDPKLGGPQVMDPTQCKPRSDSAQLPIAHLQSAQLQNFLILVLA